MASSGLLLIATIFCGWMLARRVLKETDPWLAAGLSPLLGFALLILWANFTTRQNLPYAAYLFLGLGLCLIALKTAPLKAPSLTRWQAVSFGAGGLVTLLYTLYSQQRYLDSDNWIHGPLIAHYMRGIFPPVHPFFPTITMHGHYGRDLLMASLTPNGWDPLGTVWLVNPLLQVAGYLVLVSSIRRLTGSPTQGITGAAMAYFGICVGFRVGLVDTFDGNNGVVYALLILLFHLMYRTLELGDQEAGPGVWLLSGTVLGIYQVVYETNFGLLMLTGLTLALLVARKRRVWIGVLLVAGIALGMAVTEGGPFTDLAHTHDRPETQSQQNLRQHVTMVFPKKEFLDARVTTAEYMRLSVAFRTPWFKRFKPVIRGQGYMSIFDPRFLVAHWLPLFLCPLSLVLLIRRRNFVGIGYWIFGAYAYLVPGLINFGPVYEWEYFRWEFAAGFGFAVALGLALAPTLFERGPVPLSWDRDRDKLSLTVTRRFPVWLAGVLVLLSCLAAGEQELNSAIIYVQKHGLTLFSRTSTWRVEQPDLGIDPVDIKAMGWLSRHLAKGDQVLTNLGSETPKGLWPDSVLATLTGAFPAGRARPPDNVRVHAYPNYQRSNLAKAFYATGRVDLLQAAGVGWLYLNPERLPASTLARVEGDSKDLKPCPRFVDKQGNRRQIYQVLPSAFASERSQPPLQARAVLETSQDDLRTGRLFFVRLTVHNATDRPRAIGWIKLSLLTPKGKRAVPPLELLGGRKPLAAGASRVENLPFGTPLEDGSYQLVLSLPHTTTGRPEVLARVPLEIDFLHRLAAIHPRLDLPDSFTPRRYYKVRLGLTSQQPIKAGHEVVFYYRLKRPGGDYVWRLDSIPQKLELDLEPGVERVYYFDFLSPWDPGVYRPQLYLKDLLNGRVVRLKGALPTVKVAAPR